MIRSASSPALRGFTPVPQQRLMAAVLDHAVNDFQRSAAAHTTRGKRLFAEIEAWFASDDENGGPFSFVTICHALGLDESYIRSGLARWREQHSTAGRLPRGRGAAARGAPGNRQEVPRTASGSV
jgi:hypothetical protein